MSVLIRGMEMPKNCRRCQFQSFEECGVDYHDVSEACYIGEYDTSCPLVNVLPHGRLIDADELKTAFPCGESVRTECVRATIDHAPTVLEAEEGET